METNKKPGIITLIILSALTVIVGYISFQIAFPDYPFLRKLYYAFQLFTTESGDRIYESRETISWYGFLIFNLARFLAVSTLIYTIVFALYTVLKDELYLTRVKYMNKHVIICGLGEIGFALANNYDEKDNLVIIENNVDNENLSKLKKQGVKIVKGNALDPQTLEKAGVSHAKCLIALTGDDFSNLTIIRNANEIYKKYGRNNDPIRLAANIDSRNLKTAASQEGLVSIEYDCSFSKILDEYFASASEYVKKDKDGNRIAGKERYELAETELKKYNPDCAQQSNMHINQARLFNINELAARYIHHCYPPDRFRPVTKKDDPPVHILILGYSQMGEELLKLSVQNCHYLNQSKTRITLVSLDADLVEQKARNKRNRISEIVDIQFIRFNPHHLSHQFIAAQKLHNVDIIYICSPNESTQASYSVKAREIFGNNIPIVRSFARDVFTRSDSDESTYNVFVYNEIARYALIIDESIDKKAIATHNRWLKREIINYIDKVNKAISEDVEKIPIPKKTMKTWHLLDDETRDDNRSVVEHNFVKIRAMGQLNKWNTCEDIENAKVDFSFQKDEAKVWQLAEMEHRRWMATKFYYGWEYNVDRKDELKRHNNLLAFEKLDDRTKNIDYNQIKDDLQEVWGL